MAAEKAQNKAVQSKTINTEELDLLSSFTYAIRNIATDKPLKITYEDGYMVVDGLDKKGKRRGYSRTELTLLSWLDERIRSFNWQKQDVKSLILGVDNGVYEIALELIALDESMEPLEDDVAEDATEDATF